MSYAIDRIVSIRELKQSAVPTDTALLNHFAYALHSLMKVVQDNNYNFDSIVITLTAVGPNEARSCYSHGRVSEQPRTITTIEEAK